MSFDIKNVVRQNAYLYNLGLKLAGHHNNRRMEERIRECSGIDSISDYARFKECIMGWKSEPGFSNQINAFRCVGAESQLYGHLKALCDYSGTDDSGSNLALPGIEHGVDFYEFLPADIDIMPEHNYIFQGEFKKKSVHEVNPYIPAYSIGPYVHYADNYYADDVMAGLKEKFGKTLLVFPFHSYETNVVSYDTERFADDILNVYGRDFDTVMVSVYWNDVGDEMYRRFEEKGAVLVSSGFRGDPHFLNRLKTIILLSDASLGNDLGAHIGYSVYLGKPHILISGNQAEVLEKDKVIFDRNKEIRAKTLEIFRREFSYDRYLAGFDGKESGQYEKFWGGGAQIKSPDEIRCIFEVSRDLLHRTFGFRKNLKQAVEKMLRQYLNAGQDAKYSTLKNSLGSTDGT